MDIKEIEEKPPPRSILIADDLPSWASQKDYNDPYVKTLERIIPTCRHRRKLTLIFVAQSSGLVDKFFAAAQLIFLKPIDMLFEDVERQSVARLYRGVNPIFERMSERQQLRHAYCLSSFWKGLVRVDLPRLPLA